MLEFNRKSIIKNNILLFMSDEDRNDSNALKIIDFTINKVAQDVASFCNLKINEIPEELDGTLTSLTNQYLDTHKSLPSQQSDYDELQSLTEGDVSWTFKSPGQAYQELQSVNTITDDYVDILVNFRKLNFD
ncbi:hypothetical protein DY123_07195 [Apilactobacillus micheneri]|uniref:hypothetical protein n=1 Tax=Apilactobacillus micheneri TaxID=1899430 RepID=UPI001127C95D|nr:hypothetical protein [Apilactobacillus micheneri]TPR41268.1 hypothetical protein DY123_07195 [Apilactobacillus micheneri]